MRILVLACLFFLSSCTSWKSVAPTALGAVGAGVGALGGPGTAFAGGGLGAAAGQIIKGEEKVKQQAEELKAISEGDVKKLLEIKLQEERGWFENLIEGIYDILKLSALGLGVIYVFQFLYHRHFAKKNNQHK